MLPLTLGTDEGKPEGRYFHFIVKRRTLCVEDQIKIKITLKFLRNRRDKERLVGERTSLMVERRDKQEAEHKKSEQKTGSGKSPAGRSETWNVWRRIELSSPT
jgi:hypothetical protein